MNSNIDQEVIDELIAMLEDHIASGMKKPEAAAEPEAEAAIPGVEAEAVEAEEPVADEDEDMKKLMELYSKD